MLLNVCVWESVRSHFGVLCAPKVLLWCPHAPKELRFYGTVLYELDLYQGMAMGMAGVHLMTWAGSDESIEAARYRRSFLAS